MPYPSFSKHHPLPKVRGSRGIKYVHWKIKYWLTRSNNRNSAVIEGFNIYDLRPEI